MDRDNPFSTCISLVDVHSKQNIVSDLPLELVSSDFKQVTPQEVNVYLRQIYYFQRDDCNNSNCETKNNY